MLLAISFFLFCISSFEAIINNWTTTYLVTVLPISTSQALYALSLYVAGMAVMRILLGSVFRRQSARAILAVSGVFLLAGCLFLHTPANYFEAVAGLVMIGIGLAAGFPVMLGFVGSLYAEVSATAFSMVLTIALIGNMLINYGMGLVAETYGVGHLTTMGFALMGVMTLLAFIILKKTKIKHV